MSAATVATPRNMIVFDGCPTRGLAVNQDSATELVPLIDARGKKTSAHCRPVSAEIASRIGELKVLGNT